MFKNNFVVSVKLNGQIAREDRDLVKLPFNSEYSILLKNLESRDALVNIQIDGENVTDNGLIVSANSTSEIKGFIKNHSFTNRFKFIKKTKQISDFRGDKIDDGLIRVEYTFEKEKPIFIEPIIYRKSIIQEYPWSYPSTGTPFIGHISTDYDGPSNATFNYKSDNTIIGGVLNMPNPVNSVSIDDFVDFGVNVAMAGVPVEDGITVKGSEINEGLQTAYMDELEENSNVMTLRLKGYTKSGRPVLKIRTMRQKLLCSTCGTLNKSSFKFCTNCGTFLE